MLDNTYHGFKYQSPITTIKLLEHCWENQETYNDHVETLRRLLLFIKEKAEDNGQVTGLWDIKSKDSKKLNKLLQKTDDLLVKVKGYA